MGSNAYIKLGPKRPTSPNQSTKPKAQSSGYHSQNQNNNTNTNTNPNFSEDNFSFSQFSNKSSDTNNTKIRSAIELNVKRQSKTKTFIEKAKSSEIIFEVDK